jgi:cysteine-rich repeat protein
LFSTLIVAACTATPSDDSGGFCGDGVVDPGEDCDDGGRASGDGCSSICLTEGQVSQFVTTANWTLKNLPDTATTCPTGFETAAVTSQLVDASDQPVSGTVAIDLFNCASGTGTTAPLAAGRYLTFVAITNADGTQTYAQSVSAIVDLTTQDQTYTASIYNDAGYFSWSWMLQGATTNAALTCAQAAAAGGTELISTSTVSGSQAVSDIWSCVDGTGITAALAAGTYTLSCDALDASMQSIGTSATLTNQTIVAPNVVTDLGTITIPINGL